MKVKHFILLEKTLSAFMPNKNHKWNEIMNVGNPTKSQSHEQHDKQGEMFEACKQDAPSKA